tara:strand:+ start:2458 stop:9570 length:7113 start_codon:yes stop_codon:yes gene_type:complete
MAKKENISTPKRGMNRSNSPHLLQADEYLFQKNGNSYDEGGEKFNLTDEHSNILASKFKTGFRVVGKKEHEIRNKTYFMLHNPDTKVSEIGFVTNDRSFDYEQDSGVTQATPLEETTQVAHQNYQMLLEDSCNLCLDFDLAHPIFDIIIKEENIGTTIFWTETPGKNVLRYINLDKLAEYRQTGSDNCGNVPVDTCLDCDKLRVFKLNLELNQSGFQKILGGALKKGSYEVFGAYCDELGNEFTSYVSLTPIIPLFDDYNIIHEQVDNNAETNYSIKLNMDRVDTRFERYKIVVKYYSSLGSFINYELGVFNTENKTIIISDNDGITVPNSKLFTRKPIVESVDGLATSGGILFLNGVKQKEPINLQPVVSLLGASLKWKSYLAKEDLYANADGYQYLGYNRGENQAFAMSLLFDDGSETNNFILIPPPLAANDPMGDVISEAETSPDILSITSFIGQCDGDSRNRYFQYRNTASEIGACIAAEGVQTVKTVDEQIAYTNVDIPDVPSGAITLELSDEESFIDLKTYIQERLSNISLLIPQPLSGDTDISAYVDLSDPAISGINNPATQVNGVTENPEILDPYSAITDTGCFNYTNAFPEEIVVEGVVNEVTVFEYKNEFTEYASISRPENDIIYETNGADSQMDYDFSYGYNSFIRNDSDIVPFSRRRSNINSNFQCTSPDTLILVKPDEVRTQVNRYIHENLGYLTEAQIKDATKSLLATQGTIADPNGYFSTNLHRGAVWFKSEVNNRTKYFLNISEKTRGKVEGQTFNGIYVRYGVEVSTISGIEYYDGNTRVRVSVFENCSSTTPLLSIIVDLEDDNFITLEEGVGANQIPDLSQKNNLVIAVDAPIRTSKGFGDDWNDYVEIGTNERNPPLSTSYNSSLFVPTYILALPNGAWNMVERSQEPKRASITFDSITLSKDQVFSTTCRYDLPVINDCEPVSYKYGYLGLYESTDKYPDNSVLYDSKNLVIDKTKITSVDLLNDLSIYKDAESEGNIILNDNATFICKNIRHYKMPGNDVSPFIYDKNLKKDNESIVSPLGLFLDPEAVDNMLDVAVDNGLLTQKQKDSIIEYKIYRADTSNDRSIIGSGLTFQTKKYQDRNREIHYANFPYNMLGDDVLFENASDSSDDTGSFSLFQAAVPEFDYGRPALTSEVSIEGFQFGTSNNMFTEVEDHAKMTILGKKANSLATVLAIVETAAELLINLYRGSEAYRIQFGFTNSVNPFGIGLGIAVAALGILEGIASSVGRYRLEWLRTFENLGTPYNFGYYLASTANYNYIKTIQQQGNTSRALHIKKYLPDGLIDMSDTTTGEIIRINNVDREAAPFFYLGNDYPIQSLPLEYVNYDNSDRSPYYASQPLSSQQGCDVGRSESFSRNVASPYMQFKNYIPNQYGAISSINWVNTGASHKPSERGNCIGDFLGGDTFISRHSKKRKTRIFNTDLFGSADNTPFPYKFYGNYGTPKYYIDFKVNSEFSASGRVFPEIFYDVKTDCGNNNGSFYLEPPSKFYLYYYGYPSFLTETRVNTNFRNAQKELENQFYPQNSDIEKITQEKNVSVRNQESYFYNRAYSNINKTSFKGLLGDNYNKEQEAKKAYNRNIVMNSITDVDENSITEPWLMYLPNDVVQLKTENGFLTGLKGIESGQIMVLYENALEVQNEKNPFTDGLTSYNADLGDGGIFSKRALELQTTDSGFGGSQSKSVLSCEFGHFYADMERGSIFQYLGADKRYEISRYANEKPNGMDVWFKEHLPLKLLRSLPNYSNIDNPFNGVGIHWGYDSKYRRVLLTKKDYIPLADDYCTSDGQIFRTDNIADFLPPYEELGYTYEGIENCNLRFTRETTRNVDFQVDAITTVPNKTDIYVVFDTTAMTFAEGQTAVQSINTWITNQQIQDPSFVVDLWVLPFAADTERYLGYPRIIYDGSTATVTTNSWDTITVLPPNYNTPQWVPTTKMLLLAFGDTADPEYHSNTLVDGFSVGAGLFQPTPAYLADYNDFITLHGTFEYFKAIFYPINSAPETFGGALILQGLAAIKGTLLTQQQIDATNTTTDVSLLLTENPYFSYPLIPLENFGWVGQYDKLAPAQDVFSSQQFQQDLDSLILSESNNTTTVTEVRVITETEVALEPLDIIELTDPAYFKDVSWTITYRPETGGWESYMDYKPNYYVSHSDYFQSGLNTGATQFGLWSHLLSNKSYRVFYGQKFPYVIEYLEKNEYLSKRLEDVTWNAQLRRYHNSYDYAAIQANPFTKMTIYNNFENSGALNLIDANGTLSQMSQYPIKNMDNTQDILVTYDDHKYNSNYFYNRVLSNKNNELHWAWDENQIEKTINPLAVSFSGKKKLERMEGNFFVIRMERDANTNLDLDFRWSQQKIKPKV